jgi:hypothetical protein
MSILPALMELTNLSGILQVPSSLAGATTIMASIVGASSSSLEGAEPLPKKACSGAYLLVSSLYVCAKSSVFHVTFCSYLPS